MGIQGTAPWPEQPVPGQPRYVCRDRPSVRCGRGFKGRPRDHEYEEGAAGPLQEPIYPGRKGGAGSPLKGFCHVVHDAGMGPVAA